MHRCNLLHSFQCLQAALRLPCFAGLRPKAINEATHMRDRGLLLCEGCCVLGEASCALALELGIVTPIAGRHCVVKVQYLFADLIEEAAVVGDHEQSSLVLLQP